MGHFKVFSSHELYRSHFFHPHLMFYNNIEHEKCRFSSICKNVIGTIQQMIQKNLQKYEDIWWLYKHGLCRWLWVFSESHFSLAFFRHVCFQNIFLPMSETGISPQQICWQKMFFPKKHILPEPSPTFKLNSRSLIKFLLVQV